MINNFPKILVVTLLFAIIISCGTSDDYSPEKECDFLTENGKYKFGLVVGNGGFDDQGFNEMHLKGMVEASEKYGINFEPRAFTNDSHFQDPMQDLIDENCNVIIAGAWFFKDQVDELSLKYPEIHFILNDSEAISYRENVTSITYKQNEGSFLAGALAAMVSETGNIAFMGSVNIPVINDIIAGYKAGAEYIKPDINLTIEYLSDLMKPEDTIQNPWIRPDLAKTHSINLYENKGVDVIFHASGNSGVGGLQAAEITGKFAIGVDSDQDYLAEGFVLTSMMKNIDTAIVNTIGELLKGDLKNENYYMSLENNGIGLSPMTFTKDKISPEYLKVIEDVKADIIAGKIVVPTAYE